MRERDTLLFSEYDLVQVLDGAKKQMVQDIDKYPPNKLLNSSTEDLIQYFVDLIKMAPITLLVDHIQADQNEIEVDISQDRSRAIFDRSQPLHIKGTNLSLHIPYKGEADLFLCKPTTFTFNPPRGNVTPDTLIISIVITGSDGERAKQDLMRSLGNVKQYIDWIEKDIEPFNKELPKIAQVRIEQRKAKLLEDQGLVESLGFPLRRRPGADETYATPKVRRKAVPRPPSAPSTPYSPEPELALDEFDHIIGIIEKTASMLERSPEAFKDMDEENLRNQFLVPLNSHYEGQSTGETFNSTGKTDILIRDGDRSVFIAECKIWSGPKSLIGAIDQILGYATWRDGKLAILLFNRNKDFSAVLNQIPDVIASHASFKRKLDSERPNENRCIFSHPDNDGREIYLSVLAFDVPR